MPIPEKPLLSPKQVAKLLGVSINTAKGLPIPFFAIGATRRYRPEDVEDYLDSVHEKPSSKNRNHPSYRHPQESAYSDTLEKAKRLGII